MKAATFLSVVPAFLLLLGAGCSRSDNADPTSAPVREIMALAERSAKEDGNVNFCGFFPGMSRHDAMTLAAHYGLEAQDWTCSALGSVEEKAVWELAFSPEGVRRVTKAGKTADEQRRAIAKRIGDMSVRHGEDIRDKWYEYKTDDGIEVVWRPEPGSVRALVISWAAMKTSRPLETDAARLARQRAEERLPLSIIADMVPIPGTAYKLGRHEVTQAQWEGIMGWNPSEFSGADHPVERVSLESCEQFIAALNALPVVRTAGIRFRLPTHEEWEYACRAGATGRYCLQADGTEIAEDTLGQVAWFQDNSDHKTHPVGRKKPNAWGLYDMHGNVWEWASTADREIRLDLDGNVYRGGSWGDLAGSCASSNWRWGSPSFRDDSLGFRLCADETEAERDMRLASVRAQIVADMVDIPGVNYKMGKTEVTQAQWEAVMGENPSARKGADNPVECVSWDDCQEFLKKLNALPAVKESGLTFRLPTDREWEYACRAGAAGEYCLLADGTEIAEDTLGQVAWFKDNSDEKTHPVGRKKPNAWGLYDMHGNVLEWTSTEDGEYRVIRGSGINYSAEVCGSSNQGWDSPDKRFSNLGFRLCAERQVSEEERKAAAGKVASALLSGLVQIPDTNYKMGKTEVTQAQWEAVMGENPSWFMGADNPVECVSWDDCQEFLEKLNALPAAKESGLTFRLPTQEEWEYACRAGAAGRYCLQADGTEIAEDTLGQVAWFKDNSDGKTHPVGQKKPNAWGLCDMHGNVWEWTSTEDGEYRVFRGGDWYGSAGGCGSSGLFLKSPSYRNFGLGFRLCADETEAERDMRLASVRAQIVADMVDIPGTNYKMGKTEVTQAQWESVTGENLPKFKNPNNPVENVSWDDCQEFLKKLNALPAAKESGLTFRLPTEEEWEYACRAGATGDYCRLADGTEITEDTFGQVAWFVGNSDWKTHPVGQKKPNAWGLYDMHGNVWEWTSTEVGEYRVNRGGSWGFPPRHCGFSYRGRGSPSDRMGSCGFRICAERQTSEEEQKRLCAERLASEEERKAAAEKMVSELLSGLVQIPGTNYKMGKTEVTQAQWEAVMGENPSCFKGDNHPVEWVSWDDCQEFLKKLNALPAAKESGLTFRLPTEEEWEYACRAGAAGEYCLREDGTEIAEDTLGQVAWFQDNTDGKTHPVGQKKPNAWGLYDMHGNVREWTSTEFGEYRVNRGGSYFYSARRCASSFRGRESPSDRMDSLGFRLCAERQTSEEERKRLCAERQASEEERNAAAEKVASALLSGLVQIPGTNYKMGKTEVTQAQWEAVTGENPSWFKGADHPVEFVSWDDCQEFLRKLNALPAAKESGLTFRLPTEEEWEYACRAGATGDYCRLADGTEIMKDTLGQVAWFQDNSDGKTHPVGRKKPNAWGLYDMHGNVSEWTSTAVGEYRVIRGGTWGSSARFSEFSYRARFYESSYRGRGSPSDRGDNLGFRLCAERQASEEERKLLCAERQVSEEERKAAAEKVASELLSGLVQIPDKNYKMGKTEVTQAQWEAVMDENPSGFKSADHPVEFVSWDDCQEFLKKLNALTAAKESGLTFRLPTEKEWEYAARAGATGDYCRLADGTEIAEDTLGQVAWFEDNSDGKTHPVGRKKPNAWGLYDMQGNVSEWTSTARGEGRVYRGGGYFHPAGRCVSSCRDGLSPPYRFDSLGFRLCASVAESFDSLLARAETGESEAQLVATAPAPAQARIDAPPSAIKPIRPAYPTGARQRGEEGDVVLELDISAQGHVTAASVFSSSGYPDLDDEALRAARKARFVPARSGRVAVATTARITIEFRLSDFGKAD